MEFNGAGLWMSIAFLAVQMIHYSQGEFGVDQNFVYVNCDDPENQPPPGVTDYDCQVFEGSSIEMTSGVYSSYSYTDGGTIVAKYRFSKTGEKTTVIDVYAGQYDSNPTSIDDATAVEDFAPVIIENGLTDFMLSYIDIVDDCDVENDEIFTVYDGSFPYDFFVDFERVVIKDNDDNYWIENEHFDVMETIGTFQFTVMRDPIGQRLQHTLEFATCDITATSPSDFQSVTNGQITFSQGSTSAMGFVDIEQDVEREDTEVFAINIFFNDPSDTGCTGKVIKPCKAYVTIHDSFTTLFKIEQCEYTVTEPETGTTQFTFKILRMGNVASGSTISYDIRDLSTTSGQDYVSPSSTSVTFNPSDPSKDVSVTINADTSDETPETFEVTLSIQSQTSTAVSPYKAIVTIQDVSTTKSCISVTGAVVLESDRQVQLTLRREGNTNGIGSIAVVTEDVDAIAPNDYTVRTINDVVTFQTSEKVKTITIAIEDDFITEPPECFKVKLQPATQSQTALGVCTPEVLVQIKDDDDQFKFEGTYFRVFEDHGTFDINVERFGFINKASSVRVASVQGTQANSATIGADFSLPSATVLQFAPNQQSESVTISITPDSINEGDEEITLVLNPFSSAQQDQIGVPNMATVVISDNAIGIGSGAAVNMVNGEFTITNAEFTLDLTNPFSAGYLALKSSSEQQLAVRFRSLPGFLSVTVTGFLPGSVRVLYEVMFDSSAGSDQADVVRTIQAIAIDDDFTQDSQQTGSSECRLRCLNGGVCIAPNTCYCPSAYTGAQCQTQIPVDDNDVDLTNDAIIGIVLGVMGLILLLVLVVICFCALIRRPTVPKERTIEQQSIQVRPYDGENPAYIVNEGVMGLQPLY